MNLYPYMHRRKYPHLSTDDSNIWDRFMALESNFFDQVSYDVGVGAGIDVNPLWPNWLIKDAKRLTQKRIDVVAFKDHIPWIVEIKPILDLTAPGQAKGYQILYDLAHPRRKSAGALIICQVVAPDCLHICQALNVKHYQLKTPAG